MKTYTIDAGDNITAFGSAKEAEDSGEPFNSQKELARLAEGWPVTRLAAIWNSLPGGKPVKRFQSRPVAVTRIWTAIQSLESAVAAQTAVGAPNKSRRQPSHDGPRSARGARRQQEGRGARPDPPAGGRYARGADDGYRLAGTFGPRLPQRRHWQEDGPGSPVLPLAPR